jgi:serine/threonine-protein kinase
MSSEDRGNSNTGFGGGLAGDSAFGELVVKSKLASSDEVKECMTEQKRLQDENSYRPLSDLLVDNGYITDTQAQRILTDLGRKSTRQQIPGYQILKELGRGAMAKVYQARQLSLDRIVAIKILPRRYSESPEFVDRFYREGKAAAKLNHRNIVQAIDVGASGPYHYFVMEYVDGYTVHEYLAKNQRYSEAGALEVILHIADALAHAHEKGLVHRDVKPKNIMIAKEGDAKLADMGLAREVADTRLAQSEAGRAYGTPYYISPEQIHGKVDIDYRADIYSLGATFYHMVTGRVPFEGPNPTAVMLKHLREPLTPPDHLNPELSVGCAEIIEIMMAKKREDRYQSTQDLLEDLRAVRDGRPPIHARAIFDVNELENLEEGGLVSDLEPWTGSSSRLKNQLSNWKVASVILMVLLFLSILVNIALIVAGSR